MWMNVTKSEFDAIAIALREAGKGYEWHTGNYTAIKLTEKDWYWYFDNHL